MVSEQLRTGFVLLPLLDEAEAVPFTLASASATIGRVPGNDVVLNRPSISRRHAKVVVGADGKLLVHDLDSHNGVFVNGKKIRTAELSPDDKLYIGDVCLLVQAAQIPVPSAVPEAAPERQKAAFVDVDVLLRAIASVCDLPDDADVVSPLAAALAAFVGDAEVVVVCLDAAEPEVIASHHEREPRLLPALCKHVAQSHGGVLALASAALPVAEANWFGPVTCVPVALAPRRSCVVQVLHGEGPVEAAQLQHAFVHIAAACRLVSMRARLAQAATTTRPTLAPASMSVSAEAKVEAAEQHLQLALAEQQALTERLFALESENLRGRQQVDVEKKAVIDAKREAERARLEASKLEQGLARADAELQRLQAQVATETDAHNELVRQHAQALNAEKQALEVARNELANGLVAHQSRVDTVAAERDALRDELARAQASQSQVQDALVREQETSGELEVVRAEAIRLRTERDQIADEAKAQAEANAAELAKLQQALSEQTTAHQERIAALEAELRAAATERAQTTERAAQLQHDQTEAATLREELTSLGARNDALLGALRATLAPEVVHHLLQVTTQNGALQTEAIATRQCCVYIDAWDREAALHKLAPAILQQQLGQIAVQVASSAKGHGGSFSMCGSTGFVIRFEASAPGAAAALQCALDVCSGQTSRAMVAALHVGDEVSGFFGCDALALPFVVGEAVQVAHTVAHLVDAPGCYGTETFKALLEAEDGIEPPVVMGRARTDFGVRTLLSFRRRTEIAPGSPE